MTAARPWTNLPARRTSFVGRDVELAAIGDRLREHALVSLVGVGGAGKTSLATEVARRVADRYRDGVWLVDLLPVDSARVAEQISNVLGLGTLADDTLGSLVDRLRDRRLLIVLDNCEHVLDGAAQLADALLGATNELAILATSREPLRVPGEAVARIQPLVVPAPGADEAEVLSTASARLLVDRVRAIDASFEPTGRDTRAIGEICRRLDGLPLALELVAARVGALGVEQVAGRLDDRFGLLAARRRPSIAHHRTLREAIAWSVDLLDDRERLLLARISVFAGGFDLDAAEVVCADERVPVDQVSVTLGALVERSLVIADRLDGSVRYRLLETIREFATGLLDAAAIHHRHLGWSVDLARAIGDGFLVRTEYWYERLRAEFPNLRAAFRWALDHDEAAAALDLAVSLRWAPFNTGYLYREHSEWIEAALASARRVGVDDRLLGRGLRAAGAVAGLANRSAEAVELLGKAVELLEPLDATLEIVWCEMWLGAFLADLGRFREAVEHTGAGLALAERLGIPAVIVYLANQHGENAAAASVLLPATEYAPVAHEAHALAARLAAEHGIEEGLVRARHGLAVLDARVDPGHALGLCLEALVQWRRLGSGNRLILAFVMSARVAVRAGDRVTAHALLEQATEVIAKVGWNQPFGRLLETAALCALDLGDVKAAATLAGGASVRFLTPRWYVEVDADARLREGRSPDPVAWDHAAEEGARMSDDDLAILVRQVCQRSPMRVPDPPVRPTTAGGEGGEEEASPATPPRGSMRGVGWRIGDLEIDTERIELRRGGELVPVEPQVFDVLAYLVRHRDHVVTKEELLDNVWGDRFVSESALTSRIKAARRAIGDDGQAQRLIRTHHGRGYRFIGEVEDLAVAPAASPDPEPVAVVTRPPIQYARSGSLSIAYQVTGGGPIDIVLVPGFVSHLELDWVEPRHAHFLNRLGQLGRLIRFDKRGTGLSDRPGDVADLEARMDDLRAVMDAAGSERAVVFGYSEGGAMAILFSATYPERCAALVLYGAYAKRLRTPDYPWAPTFEARQAYAEQLERDWGWEADMRVMCPSADEQLARWWGERCRAAASPGAARRLIEMNSLVDVRHVLPSVHLPALVLHRIGDRDSSVEEGRYIADHLPNARFVALPGADHFVAVDPDQLLDPVEQFLADLEPAAVDEWTLATVLAVHTARPDVLDPVVEAAAARFKGRTARADGALLASFDGPARALRCAAEVARAAAARAVPACAGLHIGEVRRGQGELSGAAVELAHRAAGCGEPGEVVVTQAVLDLVPGSGLRFEPRAVIGLPGDREQDVHVMVTDPPTGINRSR